MTQVKTKEVREASWGNIALNVPSENLETIQDGSFTKVNIAIRVKHIDIEQHIRDLKGQLLNAGVSENIYGEALDSFHEILGRNMAIDALKDFIVI